MPKVSRLLNFFQPEHYELKIYPNLDKLRFKATVHITGKLRHRTRTVALHAHGLKLSSVQLHQGRQLYTPSKIELNSPEEELKLHFSTFLRPGLLSLIIEYQGQIDTHPHGLYRSTYHEGSIKKYLLASQFESIYARRLLPCIDEPAAKATFQLAIVLPKAMIALSNTLVKAQSVSGQIRTTIFKTTPKMSPYLLAVIAGDWRYKQIKTRRGTLIRTYAIPTQIKFANESLQIAKQALEFYEAYFGVAYPLENLNQIAMPDMEPGVGAMENWGCVVYRADSLLVDPHHTSLGMRIFNTVVITHELAHMWFGNLVTMAWWDDLWLNEGFAAWIEYKAADVIRPDWYIWREFVSNDMLRAMRQDSYSTTHSVYAAIQHPLQINETFDDITYRKGSSSIRMLEQYLGADTFRRGLRAYIKTFAYGNATRDDLWKVLEEVSAKPVRRFMEAWLRQPGHPVVSYYQTKPGQLQLKQQVFRYNQSANHPRRLWPIPISLVGSDSGFTFAKPQANWKVTKIPKFLKLNVDQSGFYRVNYPAEDLQTLAKAMAGGELAVLDMLGFLADQLDLTIAGMQPITQLLNILLQPRQIKIAEVWDQIASAIGAINHVFGSDELEELLAPYVHELIADIYHQLEWKFIPKQTHNDKSLQLIILGLAARYQYADAPATVIKLFNQIQAGRSIDPDIREIVLVTIARHGSTKDYQLFRKWHKQTEQSEEQRRLARAMTNFKQPALAKESLKFMRSSSVRIQDSYVWLIYLMRNRYSRDIAWNFFKHEWQWIYETFGGGIVMKGLVEAAVGSFSAHTMATEVRQFFKGKSTTGFSQGIKNGLEIIEFQASWKKRDRTALFTYLRKFINQ